MRELPKYCEICGAEMPLNTVIYEDGMQVHTYEKTCFRCEEKTLPLDVVSFFEHRKYTLIAVSNMDVLLYNVVGLFRKKHTYALVDKRPENGYNLTVLRDQRNLVSSVLPDMITYGIKFFIAEDVNKLATIVDSIIENTLDLHSIRREMKIFTKMESEVNRLLNED